MRVLVLLRHDGHWEQQKLQAVLPQRQASYMIKHKLILLIHSYFLLTF